MSLDQSMITDRLLKQIDSTNTNAEPPIISQAQLRDLEGRGYRILAEQSSGRNGVPAPQRATQGENALNTMSDRDRALEIRRLTAWNCDLAAHAETAPEKLPTLEKKKRLPPVGQRELRYRTSTENTKRDSIIAVEGVAVPLEDDHDTDNSELPIPTAVRGPEASSRRRKRRQPDDEATPRRSINGATERPTMDSISRAIPAEQKTLASRLAAAKAAHRGRS